MKLLKKRATYTRINMETLSLEDLADLLSAARIEATHDLGHVVVHVGRVRDTADRSFVAVNDSFGRSWVSWG
jgi:hypothetical protein